MISRILIYNIYSYCGGTLVLSELCTVLRSLGYDAKLVFAETLSENADECKYEQETFVITGIKLAIVMAIWKLFPFKWIENKYHLKNRFPLHARGRAIKWFPLFSKKHTIVIYPETVYGNPLKARNVVRWQLFNYKFASDEFAYSKSDLFIGYREVFNDRNFTPDIENFKISTFDSELYKRYNFGERRGTCYIVRKGRGRKDLPDSFDGPIIDSLSEEEKVHVFNQCEFCYSYDTQTFYSSIAALCGCKSIVVPEPGKCMADYRTANEPSYGVAWGDDPEEIDRASNTVNLMEDKLSGIKNSNRIEAERLVKLLESEFKTKIRKIQVPE